MAIQRTLEMDFATALNKTQRMRVYDAREDVTVAEISTAMDDIIAKNIFQKKNSPLCCQCLDSSSNRGVLFIFP